MLTIKKAIHLSSLSINLSLELPSVNDLKVTIFYIPVIKYILHLKLKKVIYLYMLR
jgi:hypothetical protein